MKNNQVFLASKKYNGYVMTTAIIIDTYVNTYNSTPTFYGSKDSKKLGLVSIP